MNRLFAHPLIQVLPWLVFMAAIWLHGERRNFTVGWHDYLLLVGTVIAVVGTIAWPLLRGRYQDPHHHDTEAPRMSWTGLIIQTLPLYCIIAINPGTLSMSDNEDFMRLRHPSLIPQRDDPEDIAVVIEEDEQPMVLMIGPQLTMTPMGNEEAQELGLGDPTPVAENPGRVIDLMQANRIDTRRESGRVTLLGRLKLPSTTRLDKANERLGGVQVGIPAINAVLYRHTMTCCAGDAQPVNVLLAAKDIDRFEAHSWIEVTGELWDTAPDIPVLIEVESVTQVEPPTKLYLTITPFSAD